MYVYNNILCIPIPIDNEYDNIQLPAYNIIVMELTDYITRHYKLQHTSIIILQLFTSTF